MPRIPGLVAISLSGAVWSGAALEAEAVGTVLARSGLRRGAIVFTARGLTVGEEKVAWADVRRVVTGRRALAFPPTSEARLRDGEVWCGRIESADARAVRLASPMLGRPVIERARVAGLSFSVSPAEQKRGARATVERLLGGRSGAVVRGTGREEATGRRVGARAVPGDLLWIDAERVAIASPLGALRIPRPSVIACSFGAGSAASAGEGSSAVAAGGDEIALLDGTRLVGRIEPAAGAVVLEHPLLGRRELAAEIILSVARSAEGDVDLTRLEGTSAVGWPLLETRAGESTEPGRWWRCRGDGIEGPVLGFVRGLRIEPRTLLRLPLARPERGRELRARWIAPSDVSGDSLLRVRIDGRVLHERTVVAGSGEGDLRVEIPAGEMLELEVEFAGGPRFPCGLILADPRLEATGDGGPEAGEGQEESDGGGDDGDGHGPAEGRSRTVSAASGQGGN